MLSESSETQNGLYSNAYVAFTVALQSTYSLLSGTMEVY